MLRRLLLLLSLPLFLAACSADPVSEDATTAQIQAALYRAPDAPKLTLITAINNRSGQGGHAALLVSGAHRAMFDPAGTWHHPTVPERGDVLYGMTPLMLDFYTDYHARATYHVVFQELDVSPEIAAQALALIAAHGPASKATCALSVSGVLQQLGYDQIRSSWYPDRVMQDFATLPGVRTRKVFDDSPDANAEILAEQRAKRVAAMLADG